MFVKNKDGDFVNLETGLIIINYSNGHIEVEIKNTILTLYEGDNVQRQAYMDELEKELAAFGKMIRVKI